jgi:hypothetical protein
LSVTSEPRQKPSRAVALRDRVPTRVRGIRSHRLVPHVLFLVVAIVLVGFHMTKFGTVSVIDENAHYDYINRFPDVPNSGDKMTQESLRVTSCRHYPADFVFPFPKCGATPYDPNAYPGGGFSTAVSTPPAYYWATAIVAHPLSAISGRDLFTAARLVGGLWLALLMSTCFLLARSLRASRLAGIGAALLIGSSSDIVSSAATLGPDVFTAAVSGLVLLAALRYDRTRRGLLLLTGAVALAALTKLTAFTAVGLAMVFLVLHPLLVPKEERRRQPLGRVLGRAFGVSALQLGVFSLLSWLWLQRPPAASAAAAGNGPSAELFAAVKIPWAELKGSLPYTFLTPNVGNFNAPFFEGIANAHLETVCVGILVIGMLAAAFAFRSAPRVSALGIGLVLLALTGPTILVLLNYYVNHIYFPLPARYGDGLLPAFAAVAAWMLRARPASRALALLGVLSVLSVFV